MFFVRLSKRKSHKIIHGMTPGVSRFLGSNSSICHHIVLVPPLTAAIGGIPNRRQCDKAIGLNVAKYCIKRIELILEFYENLLAKTRATSTNHKPHPMNTYGICQYISRPQNLNFLYFHGTSVPVYFKIYIFDHHRNNSHILSAKMKIYQDISASVQRKSYLKVMKEAFYSWLIC